MNQYGMITMVIWSYTDIYTYEFNESLWLIISGYYYIYIYMELVYH